MADHFDWAASRPGLLGWFEVSFYTLYLHVSVSIFLLDIRHYISVLSDYYCTDAVRSEIRNGDIRLDEYSAFICTEKKVCNCTVCASRGMFFIKPSTKFIVSRWISKYISAEFTAHCTKPPLAVKSIWVRYVPSSSWQCWRFVSGSQVFLRILHFFTWQKTAAAFDVYNDLKSSQLHTHSAPLKNRAQLAENHCGYTSPR